MTDAGCQDVPELSCGEGKSEDPCFSMFIPAMLCWGELWAMLWSCGASCALAAESARQNAIKILFT
jgi:hypothetical protein